MHSGYFLVLLIVAKISRAEVLVRSYGTNVTLTCNSQPSNVSVFLSGWFYYDKYDRDIFKYAANIRSFDAPHGYSHLKNRSYLDFETGDLTISSLNWCDDQTYTCELTYRNSDTREFSNHTLIIGK